MLIDDLITKHINEPYRMFTSRAENRLFLRADTAPLRLCAIAIENKMLNDKEIAVYDDFKGQYDSLFSLVNKTKLVIKGKKISLSEYIKRPEVLLKKINKQEIALMLKKYDHDVIFSVETAIKYAGYEARELERIAKIKKLDGLTISKSVDYKKITNLSAESIEKLSSVLPETLGQASRIAGVRPSDVAVLSIFLTSQNNI